VSVGAASYFHVGTVCWIVTKISAPPFISGQIGIDLPETNA
jgi:hypothetical protein